MALGGAEVFILIGITALIFLFGHKKIPEFFHSLGRSKAAFEKGVKGEALEEDKHE